MARQPNDHDRAERPPDLRRRELDALLAIRRPRRSSGRDLRLNLLGLVLVLMALAGFVFLGPWLYLSIVMLQSPVAFGIAAAIAGLCVVGFCLTLVRIERD